jgi:hypothetical protein
LELGRLDEAQAVLQRAREVILKAYGADSADAHDASEELEKVAHLQAAHRKSPSAVRKGI